MIGVKGLKDNVATQLLWLIPLRDLIGFGLWCYGFMGVKGGTLVPIALNHPKVIEWVHPRSAPPEWRRYPLETL